MSLEARAVGVRLPGQGRGSGPVPALDGVDLAVTPGRATGVVGRSGAGKSTLLRVLLGLRTPTSGEVRWEGAALPRRGRALRDLRRAVQYVPQDPAGSLEPRWTVARTLAEPLRCLRVPGDHATRVREALAQVDLGPEVLERRPAALSGGQAQRVALARALACGARVLLADEPLSSVDRVLRDELLGVLDRLVREQGVGLLLVSHDLPAVARVCSDVVVLDHGRAVERGPAARLLVAPAHAVTRALVDAVPRLAR